MRLNYLWGNVIEPQNTTGKTQRKAEIGKMDPWDQKGGERCNGRAMQGNTGVHAFVHCTFGISQPAKA